MKNTFIKIGSLTVLQEKGYIPNMCDAFEADLESGSHRLSNEQSERFNRDYPTILAMAHLIEKQRDYLMIEMVKLANVSRKVLTDINAKKLMRKNKQ
jgi:hypothetical protein